MSIFKRGTAQVITEPPPMPSIVADWSVWQGRDLRALGIAVARLDQYGDREFNGLPVPVPNDPVSTRFRFTFPPGTNLHHGGNIAVSGVEGYSDYAARFVLESSIADVTLEPVVTALPPLVRRGQFYYQPDGAPFTVKEASAFRLYERFLNGEDVSPVLAQLQAEGFNVARVWLLNTSVGHILPWEHPDFYARIPDFQTLCARFGLYTELTVFTQAPLLMPDLVTQQAHYDQTVLAVGSTFCFIEGVNEGDHRDPATRQLDNAYDARLRLWKPAGSTFDLCGGSWAADSWGPVDGNNQPTAPVYDSVRYHANDLSEWQRKQAHGAFEMAEHYRLPGIGNENTRPDHDGNPQHHHDAAAGAALLCAGSCFHSESGKHAVVMTGVDLACARAFIAGANSVDLSQREAGYVHRTDLEGPTVIRAYQRGSAIVTIGA